MNLETKNILLKTVPYLLSIAGGIVLFWVSSNVIHNENINDLVDNISASLLSIPLVFLLYDYSNYRISRKVKRTIAVTISDKINNDLWNVVILFRQMLMMKSPLDLKTWSHIQNMSPTKIANKLHIKGQQMQELRLYHDGLYDILYKSGQSNMLGDTQIQILADIIRNLARIINWKNTKLSRHEIAHFMAQTMDKISDWQDTDITISVRLQDDENHENTAVKTENLSKKSHK